MLGDETSGKTSLTIRYISGFYLQDLKLTIGVDFYSKTTNYNEKKVKLQIWDFGGEERFRFLLHQYCKGANAAFFLFNITDRLSLDHLPDWIQIIREHAGDIPILMVGNKLHLADQRTITREEAIQAAETHNLSGYVEVSAKTGVNVEKLFEVMTELLFDRYAPNINLERPNPEPMQRDVPRSNQRLGPRHIPGPLPIIIPRAIPNPEPMQRDIPRSYQRLGPRHIPRPLPIIIPRAIPNPTTRVKSKNIEFIVNEYLTLKLESRQTNIYVGGRIFQQCKYLILNIPFDGTRDYGEIESIDEAAEVFQDPLVARRTRKSSIPPETEFWGHCSNIQAWDKFGYDTRILHRNLAFPLLRELTRAGDPQARKVFKEEIGLRLESGYPNVVLYLLNQGYLNYLDKEELDTVLESPKFLKNMSNSILKKLPEWLVDKIKKKLNNLS